MSTFFPLLERSWKYATGLIGLRSNDVILTSFPKSGNTWIRFFLCNLISLREWGGETVTFPKLDATMPELGVSNLLHSWSHRTIPRVVKTHKERWPIFQGCRSILLVRDPRDVMTSYFFFQRGKVETHFDGTFSEFLRDDSLGIRAWASHYRSWKPHADLLLRFEDLKNDDVGTFKQLLSGIDVDLDPGLVEEAVQRSRFEKMKEVEKKHGVRPDQNHFNKGAQFMRKGERGSWEEVFSKRDIKYLNKVLNEKNINMYRNV